MHSSSLKVYKEAYFEFLEKTYSDWQIASIFLQKNKL